MRFFRKKIQTPKKKLSFERQKKKIEKKMHFHENLPLTFDLLGTLF